ncbi:hypothetical protein FACS189479_06960 [Spirochaetia bacterium]|nr:hypothetical protein FACS189479_06960 [Spirochaetia bacterium]
MNEKRNKTNPMASTAWILKLTFTCLLIFSTIISVNAETTLKERLEQHVYTLASDEMRGRKAGTKYAHMAAEYIIDQWEEIGIEPFFGSSYIQPFWNNRFQNLVAIIPGNDPSLKNGNYSARLPVTQIRNILILNSGWGKKQTGKK